MHATPPETLRLSIGGAIRIEVSVVMPCLNEARTVGRCVDKALDALQELGLHGEVIVTDNGSADRSPQEAVAHGARVINVVQRGYGSALRAAIAAANGRYVIMGDSDDSYDFTKLEPFIKRLRAGDDVVLGNRFQGGIRPGAMPWLHRYIGNPILSGLLNLFFHTPIHDAHCGLRAIRKDAFDRLNLNTTGMEFASEMVVKACLHGLRMSEVPVVLHPDGRGRPPHLRSFRDGWRHLRFLLLHCPLWLYMVPACLLLAAGLGLIAWLATGPRFLSAFVLDVKTMIFGVLCLLTSYQALWLWAHAQTFARITGISPKRTFSLHICEYVSVERGLLAGGCLFLAGLALSLSQTPWYGPALGPPDLQGILRYALWGFTMMSIGMQTIFGSFFLTMIGTAKKSAIDSPQATSPADRAASQHYDPTDERRPLLGYR